VARVGWTRLSGDEVEPVIAMMLCRRFRTGVRPQPSRGDGVLTFSFQDPRVRQIWQIKKFTENLTVNRKIKL
jgi:hypothetical protein